jgi:broad specificity phosphatase PhoE
VQATIDADLHENDRSATGFLPPAAFNAAADAFFAHPQDSFRGWETAAAAQARIAQAVDRIVTAHLERNRASCQGDLAIVSHGGVGTLLQCLYAGVPITRARDQPFQGHVWSFHLETRSVLHGWEPLPHP